MYGQDILSVVRSMTKKIVSGRCKMYFMIQLIWYVFTL